MVAVGYAELLDAFYFVSAAAPVEHHAFLDRTTGKIYWVAEGIDAELPEHLDHGDRYIAIPHKHALDLGTNLALRFAAAELPGKYARIEASFRRRGAYARFKDTLADEGLLDKWYAFEAEAVASALREWCEDNGIQLIEDPGKTG
jgi:Uncharacterised protein family (UPF0158)